eukprot:3454362-Prymnesium_polylepis.1
MSALLAAFAELRVNVETPQLHLDAGCDQNCGAPAGESGRDVNLLTARGRAVCEHCTPRTMR